MSGNTLQLSERAMAALPMHVAIIMDGNGRWAKKRHLPRIEGHKAGAQSAKEIVKAAAELGIKYLTLFAFSTENWNRPKTEVDTLMQYLEHYLRSESDELLKNNIRLAVIGQIDRLPESTRQVVLETIERTKSNTGLTVILALSYSGRWEITEAVREIAARVKAGELDPTQITEETIKKHLQTSEWPDPDLLIRTSGEMRISNFFLWQISYTELYVTPVLWPDFRREHFFAALEDFARRERRFGTVSENDY